MKLSSIVPKAVTGTLTCSEVMAILMDQPTDTGESHGHMHTNEGFTLNQATFVGNDTSFQKKKLQWENPTHLYPEMDIGAPHSERIKNFDYGRYVTARPRGAYDGAYQDPTRIAKDRSYVNRTGLPELPAVKETKYTIYQFPAVGRGKPAAMEVTRTVVDQLRAGNHPTLTVGTGPSQIQPAKGAPTQPLVKETEVTKIPIVKASPAHSMFPDSESMVMHLAASLMSDAGRMALREVFMKTNPGEKKTIGIFSKIAVAAVAAVDTNVPTVLVNRTLEVDQSAPRNPVSGQYPTTGNIVTTQAAIDHVVTILGHRATGDLNVITCYPSAATTLATIGTATSVNEDIAELSFGHHTVVVQRNPLPRLRW